jgi:hypothetical chaperone protein
MTNACGVDFGTSNSTVGWVKRPQARAGERLLALEDGKATLPSVVFFNADDEQVRYGRAALADYLAGYEGRLMRSLKSLLGTSLMDGQTEVAGRALPFRQLLAQFIGEVKRRAEPRPGAVRARRVRPPRVLRRRRMRRRQAGRGHAGRDRAQRGFREIGFQYEPIAAAFDYESRIDREELVLIADIGGGTSDFSLVRLGPGRAGKPERRDDILATGGVHIGGTDFDKYLSLASVMPLLGHGSALRRAPSPVQLLLQPGDLAYDQPGLYPQEHRPARRPGARRAEPAKLARLQQADRRARRPLAGDAGRGSAKIGLSDAPRSRSTWTAWRRRRPAGRTRDVFETAIAGCSTAIGATVQRLLDEAGIAPARRHRVLHRRLQRRGLLRERIAAMSRRAQGRGRPVRQHRRRPGDRRRPQIRLKGSHDHV